MRALSLFTPFMNHQTASLAELGRFDDIIDVRTPAEFAEDHIPGAINAPVLSNEERVLIGTMYKQVSPFEATRLGAALVARNIAAHLETLFADKPVRWKPLIYCWRGGKRSGSMTTWFNLIGWKAKQLEGGYKTYRRQVLDDLLTLPGHFNYRVLCGLTGSGKTRLLQALEGCGAQVLDLEHLARHRGSLLGSLPGETQPNQKAFDSALHQALTQFDAARPVFVEAESRRIGKVQLPNALLDAIHQADCIRVEASLEDRVAFLCDDYAALFNDGENLKSLLNLLVDLHGHAVINQWQALIDAGAKAELFHELIEKHYDPAYRRSSHANFVRLEQARPFAFHPNAADLMPKARALLDQLAPV